MVCYDVADDRRRRLVAKILEGYGYRVQYSVFDCWLLQEQIVRLVLRLEDVLDPDQDRIHLCPMCRKDAAAVHVQGLGSRTKPEAQFILL